MAQPHLPVSLFVGNQAVATTPEGQLVTTTPTTANSTNQTFVMSASPTRNRRSAAEGYKPKLITTIGAKPACLVNASVTYVGDEQIYAFGGFDQFTDEGKTYAPVTRICVALTPLECHRLTTCSVQPCAEAGSEGSQVELGRQLR